MAEVGGEEYMTRVLGFFERYIPPQKGNQ